MAESTHWNTQNCVDAANRIGELVDLTVFDKLKDFRPPAGDFDTAWWLEQTVDDRRNAIVDQGHHLKMIFDNMNVTLKQIVEDFDGVDSDNAEEIKGKLRSIREDSEQQIHDFDVETEETDSNHHGNGDDSGGGYNDNNDA